MKKQELQINPQKISKKTLGTGFTLVEILLTTSIFVVLIIVISVFSRNIWSYNAFINANLSNADAARKILKTMVAEIRTASTANNGAYTIGLANAQAFTFYSDIDNDSLKERVRYFMNGTILQKGVIKPTGSPLTYNVANEKISTLMSGINNSSIFLYYDKNYDGTTAALPTPISIPAIRLVKITILSDQDPNRSPIPKTFSTQVSIRNLKDNL